MLKFLKRVTLAVNCNEKQGRVIVCMIFVKKGSIGRQMISAYILEYYPPPQVGTNEPGWIFAK